MSSQQFLYETFGELIYAVAMADGIIQKEEMEALNRILANHPWASTIQWSFNYERQKQTRVEDAYNKVINACHAYGPHPAYESFIEVMTKIAEASDGIDDKEQELINSFSKDLTNRFRRDIERLQ